MAKGRPETGPTPCTKCGAATRASGRTEAEFPGTSMRRKGLCGKCHWDTHRRPPGVEPRVAKPRPEIVKTRPRGAKPLDPPDPSHVDSLNIFLAARRERAARNARL